MRISILISEILEKENGIMNKIASFTVNHLNLLTGVYVSRKDYLGEQVITTFDLRFTRPNEEPPMDNPGIHTIEHLVATFLRNDSERQYILDLWAAVQDFMLYLQAIYSLRI